MAGLSKDSVCIMLHVHIPLNSFLPVAEAIIENIIFYLVQNQKLKMKFNLDYCITKANVWNLNIQSLRHAH